jgi:diaminohydroxyphosphoribosylaminopyrimidine deaminase/5-amino-6-(5-phosphoribosylamino)uracil reductase
MVAPTLSAKRQYMHTAIRLAKRGAGAVSPNPLVGAVLVKGSRIIGTGYHHFFGGPHAEIYAVNNAGRDARGADLYINLEPCCHHGKTPPCTDTLIEAGIRRAFIGMKDPNPLVSGKGIQRLSAAGISVEMGILENECKKLNESFIKYITCKSPFVILKTAATLDGKIATHTGDSQWITGETSRKFVHRLRSEVDAVLVGIGTVLSDDPLLTSRLYAGAKKNPVRIVVDSSLRIPLSSKLLKTASRVKTIIATLKNSSPAQYKAIKQTGAEIVYIPARNGRVDLKKLIQYVGTLGIASVLIEAGTEISASALTEGIVDKILFFYAPKIIGGINAYSMVGGSGIAKMANAVVLKNLTYKKLGQDLLIEGYINTHHN